MLVIIIFFVCLRALTRILKVGFQESNFRKSWIPHRKFGFHHHKYPTDKEKFVTGIKILERKTDIKSGIDFRKSIAICVNVIPSILRMIPVLNEPAVILEESSWLDTKTHHLNIKARNVTWANYANMTEQSSYTVHETNPKWTNFKQYGRIDINGLGPFGRVIEMFAKKFLDDGAKRSLKVMEELIQERLSQQSTTRTTKSGINVDSS